MHITKEQACPKIALLIERFQEHLEAYCKVIHKNKIKVGSSNRDPDYGFALCGQRKFFVDAKKTVINIRSDIAPVYQVQRYERCANNYLISIHLILQIN